MGEWRWVELAREELTNCGGVVRRGGVERRDVEGGGVESGLTAEEEGEEDETSLDSKL